MGTAPDAREAARGHYRTTTTEWARVAPYIRFRYERARERLPARGAVVELGCGIGVGLAYLARSRPDLSFTGLDMSEEAVAFGREHFGGVPNLRLEAVPDMAAIAARVPHGAFLVALEVLEHLDDATLDVFKRDVMARVDGCVFSFPYEQKNIEGTDHLQSFTLYDIFEIFPGFETLFLRRHSIKLIGCWRRESRQYVREHLGIAGEANAIAAVANLEGPVLEAPAPTPTARSPLRSALASAVRRTLRRKRSRP